MITRKKNSSGSGITAGSFLMVEKEKFIGSYVTIAWDTFNTDSYWYSIDGKKH